MRFLKKQMVEKARKQELLRDAMANSKSIVFADFRGMTVADDMKLRRACREAGVRFEVAKNTLLLRAVQSLGWPSPGDVLTGPTAIAYSDVDPTSAPKVLAGLNREIPALKVKGGILDGELLDAGRVAYLATLPGRQDLLATVLATLQSPLTSMAIVLSGTMTGFARAVEALRTKRAEEAAD